MSSIRCWDIVAAVLGITYPEITEMQAQAIFEATVQFAEEGHDSADRF